MRIDKTADHLVIALATAKRRGSVSEKRRRRTLAVDYPSSSAVTCAIVSCVRAELR